MITVELGDIFEVKADAIIVYADGASAKSIGRAGRKLRSMIPEEEWEFMMGEIHWPIEMGSAGAVGFDYDDAPFRFMIIASTLGHLSDEHDHITNALRGVRAAFNKAKSYGCKSVAMVPPVGGGRLRTKDAAVIIRQALPSAKGMDLHIRVLVQDEYEILAPIVKHARWSSPS